MIGRYLKILKEKNNITSTFSQKQLIMTLVDFMFPATSALLSALVHAIKLVMHHPRVVNNIQEEIDRVVGTGRLVTWSDRKKYDISSINNNNRKKEFVIKRKIKNLLVYHILKQQYANHLDTKH